MISSRLDRAIAVVFSARGDQSFPESEEELQMILNMYKGVESGIEVIVFRNPRRYVWTPRPTTSVEVKLP